MDAIITQKLRYRKYYTQVGSRLYATYVDVDTGQTYREQEGEVPPEFATHEPVVMIGHRSPAEAESEAMALREYRKANPHPPFTDQQATYDMKRAVEMTLWRRLGRRTIALGVK